MHCLPKTLKHPLSLKKRLRELRVSYSRRLDKAVTGEERPDKQTVRRLRRLLFQIDQAEQKGSVDPRTRLYSILREKRHYDRAKGAYKDKPKVILHGYRLPLRKPAYAQAKIAGAGDGKKTLQMLDILTRGGFSKEIEEYTK